MTQQSTLEPKQGFGATQRRDSWFFGPALTILGLSAFLIYGTWAALQGNYFEIRQNKTDFHAKDNHAVAPYLSPFYAPLLYDKQSHHAWFNIQEMPWGLPWVSPAFLILGFPGLFRFTCYYYRKAYYRAFWLDPPACAVGEPRKGYLGENHFPLIFQNVHRYFMYFACIFLVLLAWDALKAFWWPTFDAAGHETGRFGIGLGTVIMVVNVILLGGFTLGCNSFRHLVGGRLDCFSCPRNPANVRGEYKLWRLSTWFNVNHMQWAWASLFSVGFTDVYIRLCSMGIWQDPHIVF